MWSEIKNLKRGWAARGPMSIGEDNEHEHVSGQVVVLVERTIVRRQRI